MITFTTGNILNTDCEVIVNPINCVGIMGKGLAKEIKEYFPDVFIDYEIRCRLGKVKIGESYLCKRILNFPTKYHWKDKSKMEYIEKGLIYFVNHYKEWKITSIAFPKLGCGCGGLNWEKEIKPLMIRYLNDLDIMIEIYE